MPRQRLFTRIFRWATLASLVLSLALVSSIAADPAEGDAGASTAGSADTVVCASTAQRCSIGDSNILCWPADETCPGALSEAAEERTADEAEHAAYETVIRGPQDGASASVQTTRGTQEVTVRVSGCGKCFLSQRTILPGNVQGVVLLESYSQGSVNYTGGHWAKSAFWEKSCFGMPGNPQLCGTVQRTYLVSY